MADASPPAPAAGTSPDSPPTPNGDLYLLWRLWRMPPGTLVYDADLRHWYVFEPADTAAAAG